MAEVLLSDGTVCKVSEEDLELVSRHSWCPSHNGGNQVYAQTRYKQKTVYMHRLITEAPKGVIVDHINGDSLDNRRENLRFCSKSQNGINSRDTRKRAYSRTRGVTFDRSRSKWIAFLNVDGKKALNKRFDTEEEAVAARRAAVAEHHREFAR